MNLLSPGVAVQEYDFSTVVRQSGTSTGAFAGLGMRIRSLNNNFETAPMLLYIIIIGIIGITVEKLIQLLERKLTGWQEKREI